MIKYFVILLLFIGLASCDLYTTTSDAKEVHAENGNVIAKGEWSYKRSNKMDMYDYYQKWDNTYVEYYDNGTVKSEYSSEHKRSTYGKPCKEVLSHYISYYPNGQKAYEQKDICDCSKSIYISYDEEGNVVEKRVVKTATKNALRK
jgi:antitoxin component YwqK of YwqJK toxin-antitoxin module